MPNELTNPNNVVTEERLAQFYQQILPYLGGMPDILANKFSKADLYSTDEKLIGRWIDGKPLYQKTFTGITITKSQQVISSKASLNLETLVDGVVRTGKVGSNERQSITPDDTVELFANATNIICEGIQSGITFTDCTVTVQYTKTTDSAVEIGDDTDYSTTEKIVGTWIDGKPIWQKTLEISNPSNSWTPVTLSSLGIENSELVFKVGSATFITSTGDIIGEHCFGNTSFATCMVADNSSGSSSASHCLWFKWSTTSTMSKAIVTLQYTKTSS